MERKGKQDWKRNGREKTSRWNMLVKFQTVAENTSGVGYNQQEIRVEAPFLNLSF